jgi:hypothetical protein
MTLLDTLLPAGAGTAAPPGTSDPVVTVAAGRRGLAVTAAGLLVALDAALAFGAGPGVRLPLTLAVVLLVPGVALLGLTRLQWSAALLGLVFAASLAVTLVVAQLLAAISALTANSAAAALTALCLPMLLLQCLDHAPSAGVVATIRELDVPTIGPVVPAFTLAGLALWLVSLPAVHPGAVGSIGLVSVLPLTWWAAAACALAATAWQFRNRIHVVWMLTDVALLTLMIYATPSIVEHYARVWTGYTHVGLVGYIVRDHGVKQTFDARYAWPGALNLGAVLTELTGVRSAVTFLRWSPLFFNALCTVPIYAAARALTRSERATWITVCLFLSLNWVGQDYWSPQALNFFLFLVAVAATVTWIPVRPVAGQRWERLTDRNAEPRFALADRTDRVAVVLAILLFSVASATSHQLTPFFLLAALVGLATVGRRDLGLMPVFVFLVIVLWISFGAVSFWSGHWNTLTHDVGNVGGTVNSGVGARIAGSDTGRTVVLLVRMGLSCGVWALAGLAFVFAARRLSTGAATAAALTAAPLVGIALQSYGGEMLLRVFLFSLPFACMLLAMVVDAAQWSTKALAVVVPASVLIVVALMTARYGNERFEEVFPEDMAATRFVYGHVETKSVVVTANNVSTLRMGDFRRFTIKVLPALEHPDRENPIDALRQEGITKGYIVVTRSGVGAAEIRSRSPVGWNDLLRSKLLASGVTQQLFHDGQSAVYRFDSRVNS